MVATSGRRGRGDLPNPTPPTGCPRRWPRSSASPPRCPAIVIDEASMLPGGVSSVIPTAVDAGPRSGTSWSPKPCPSRARWRAWGGLRHRPARADEAHPREGRQLQLLSARSLPRSAPAPRWTPKAFDETRRKGDRQPSAPAADLAALGFEVPVVTPTVFAPPPGPRRRRAGSARLRAHRHPSRLRHFKAARILTGSCAYITVGTG